MKTISVFIILIFLGSTACLADITTGLVGHWNFEEGQGTSTADTSGDGNNGVLSGSTLPAWVSGVVGSSAVSFNGQGYVDVGTNPVLSGGNAITVSAWIKPNSLNGYIMTHGQYNASWDLLLLNGRINFYLNYNNNPGSYPDVSLKGSFPINTSGNYWTHVVVTYTCSNGSGNPVCTSGTNGQMSLYINGVQDTGATIVYGEIIQNPYSGGPPKVDGNSTVDIYDAYLIAKYAVGVITKFPVQGGS